MFLSLLHLFFFCFQSLCGYFTDFLSTKKCSVRAHRRSTLQLFNNPSMILTSQQPLTSWLWWGGGGPRVANQILAGAGLTPGNPSDPAPCLWLAGRGLIQDVKRAEVDEHLEDRCDCSGLAGQNNWIQDWHKSLKIGGTAGCISAPLPKTPFLSI